MLIVPGHVYNFKFKSLLSSLDGIYQVSSLLSYGELIEADIDLLDTTYEAYGLTEEDFENDLDLIRAGKVIKLVSVTDPDSIQFVPEHLLSEVPDGSVQKYYHLGLAIDLGIFDDAEQLTTLKDEIDQLIQAKAGVTNSSLIYSIDDAWMSVADFKSLQDAREVIISDTHNHYTDKLALQKEIARLKTMITYYEDTLKTLAS